MALNKLPELGTQGWIGIYNNRDSNRPNNNLYIKMDQDSMIIIEVYVDDIIFGSDDNKMSQKFATDIKSGFEMYLLGELTFFLGVHISQIDDVIFISQTIYIKEMLRRF